MLVLVYDSLLDYCVERISTRFSTITFTLGHQTCNVYVCYECYVYGEVVVVCGKGGGDRGDSVYACIGSRSPGVRGYTPTAGHGERSQAHATSISRSKPRCKHIRGSSS